MENISISKIQWVIVGVISALVVIGGVLIIKHGFEGPSAVATSSAAVVGGNAATSTPAINTPTITITKSGVTGTGSFKVSLDTGNVPPSPDFRGSLVCASSVPAEACSALQKQAELLGKQIAKNTTDFGSWINLGVVRKMAGDYAGAISAWNYLTEIYPTADSRPYANMGDVYMNFTKDYSKAEVNFLKAVKLNLHDTSLYVDLYMLYANPASALHSTSSARAILQKGVTANPNADDLKQWLARAE